MIAFGHGRVTTYLLQKALQVLSTEQRSPLGCGTEWVNWLETSRLAASLYLDGLASDHFPQLTARKCDLVVPAA